MRSDEAQEVRNLRHETEPTTGLDPRNRNQAWKIIRALVAEGPTVLLTTQYLEEADQLADRIAVIDEGRIVAEGTPGDLKAKLGSGVLSVRVRNPDQPEAAAAILEARLGGVERGSDPAVLTARVTASEDAASVFDELTAGDVEVAEFALGQPSLDEVFLELTDRPVPDQSTPGHSKGGRPSEASLRGGEPR